MDIVGPAGTVGPMAHQDRADAPERVGRRRRAAAGALVVAVMLGAWWWARTHVTFVRTEAGPALAVRAEGQHAGPVGRYGVATVDGVEEGPLGYLWDRLAGRLVAAVPDGDARTARATGRAQWRASDRGARMLAGRILAGRAPAGDRDGDVAPGARVSLGVGKAAVGPSAGLALTLAYLDVLGGGDLTGGRVLVATGTVAPDGSVGRVGDVALKAQGVRDGLGAIGGPGDRAARRGHAVRLLVPTGQGDEARAAVGDAAEVLEVASVADALAQLCAAGARPACPLVAGALGAGAPG